ACVKNGLLILTAKDVLRLLPPLTITREEIDKGLAVLRQTLQEENA
ncbi:MAG TPA: aspartate aminotransferase family protein, partial [Ruminococcaceae bacterium]|nr:aspartate aminotransferase family protein [Oscillospiraceae bacterium]